MVWIFAHKHEKGMPEFNVIKTAEDEFFLD